LRTFVFEATTIASVLTILAFTIERWLHICYPLFAQKLSSSFSRAFKIIVSIWILSVVLAMPFAVFTGVEYLLDNVSDSLLCKPLNKYQNFMTTILLLSSMFLFVLPMTLISFM
jgi:neuromedin U receptor 1